MKKSFVLFIFIIFTLTACARKELPENFPLQAIEIGLAVDMPGTFEVGFVNPSYYIGEERKKSASALINFVKPVNYLFEQIESSVKTRFTGTKISVAKTVLKDVPLLPETFTGPDIRKPLISPPVDITKLKEIMGTKYVALVRIRLCRFELDARPGVPDMFIIDPVFALYDAETGNLLYLWHLGTPGGISSAEIKMNLRTHEDNDSNRELIKNSIKQLAKKAIEELTEKLVKHFS